MKRTGITFIFKTVHKFYLGVSYALLMGSSQSSCWFQTGRMALLKEYLESTSIHGLVYLVKGEGILAKVLWFLCTVCSFAMAATLIHLNILHWENSPVMVSDTRPVLLQVPMK